MHFVGFIMRTLSWLFPLTECRVSIYSTLATHTIQGFAWFCSPGSVITIQSHRSLYLWKCSLVGMNVSFRSRDLFLSPSQNIPRNGSKLALSCAGCVCMFSVDLAVDAWGLYDIALNLWTMTLRSGTPTAVVCCLVCRNPKFRPTRLVELRH